MRAWRHIAICRGGDRGDEGAMRMLQRRDCRDGRLERRQVLVVVMPRHSRRFMADNALNDMQRNPGVCRERDEGVAERVGSRLRGQYLRPSRRAMMTLLRKLQVRKSVNPLQCMLDRNDVNPLFRNLVEDPPFLVPAKDLADVWALHEGKRLFSHIGIGRNGVCCLDCVAPKCDGVFGIEVDGNVLDSVTKARRRPLCPMKIGFHYATASF